MSIAQSMVREFEAQAGVTRRFLERLPEDKLSWKPHEKSMSAGQLALHIASIPGGIARAVQQDQMQVPNFNKLAQPSSLRQILDTLEESIAVVKSVLPSLRMPACGRPGVCFKAIEKSGLFPGRNSSARSCLITGISIEGSSASICGYSMSRCRRVGAPVPTNCPRSCRRGNRHKTWLGPLGCVEHQAATHPHRETGLAGAVIG